MNLIMDKIILHILDYFFIMFHTVIILFNVFGWIIPRWRFYNLITLSLTAFSWLILGIWYGFGYCPFTDWHWRVRELLDYTDDRNSYIHFLILKITGIHFPEKRIDFATVIVFFTTYFISIYFAVKKRILNQKLKNQ